VLSSQQSAVSSQQSAVSSQQSAVSSQRQSAAGDALLHLCGNDPTQWQAIVEGLSSPPDFHETFGQFLDRHSAASSSIGS
jgi:hypothetical protein